MNSAWHFGNTTVRNPLRIKDGLSVLKDSVFNGNLIGENQERFFALELNKAGVSKVGKDPAFYGRKWRACFSQLGFITHKFDRKLKAGEKDPIIERVLQEYPKLDLKGLPFELTPNGLRMVNAESVQEQQECMLRALLAYQIPSVIEERNGALPFKPFLFILKVLTELSNKEPYLGLSPLEMGIVQTYRNYDDINKVLDEIYDYRKKYKKAEGRVAKKAVDNQLLEKLGERAGVRPSSIKDYADVNFRYPRLTGLVSQKRKRLVINSDKAQIVSQIVKDKELIRYIDDYQYLYNLWTGQKLPTDSKVMTMREIVRFRELLAEKNVIIEKFPSISDELSITELNQIRIRMENMYHNELEKNYAEVQRDEEYLKETLAYLKTIDKQPINNEYDLQIDDEPAYLEWSVWRAFLSINNLVNSPHEARRFKVDQDFFPLGCAPGGGPDLIFEFEEYVLVVEVTLTTSSRQEAAEGEPVRRHIAKEKQRIENSTLKPVYGLFIARTIDNNTAETFRIGVWYNKNTPEFLNIVPLTLSQFISLMENYLENQYDPLTFRKVLDSCLIPRNAHAPAWKEEINKVITQFNT